MIDTTDANLRLSGVLESARGLVAEPENWYRGYWYDTSRPWCMCAGGAILRVLGGRTVRDLEDDQYAIWKRTRDLFERANGGFCLGDWNDATERTHGDILKAFDTAIAAARAEEEAK
jgi:hypothetical protein